MTAGVRSNGRVLAVLVLYGRRPEEAVSWPTILSLLGRDGPLQLAHCIVHDNSPERRAILAPTTGISVCWTPENAGTAGAYAGAANAIGTHGCDWLLLLDQDTDLPLDYLDRAALVLGEQPDAAALVPRVWHGRVLVSPATIGKGGGVRPAAMPMAHAGIPTAISSGVVMRRAAFASVPPFPRAIWLDYVDHWMFLSLARNGSAIGLIDADLQHDLSVRTPAALSSARLAGILAAESAFNDAMTGGRHGRLRLRRMIRAARHVANGRFDHAWTVIRHTLARATSS